LTTKVLECSGFPEGEKQGEDIRSAMNSQAVASRLWPNFDMSLCIGSFLTLFAMFFMQPWGLHSGSGFPDGISRSA
jgi:hypothetical protein